MKQIVAAAIRRRQTGLVFMLPRPGRHCPILRTMSMHEGIDAIDVDQGFLTNEGEYVNRYEAMKIALKAGQVKKGETFQKHMLFSEDIW